MTDASAPYDVKASARGGPIRWLIVGGLTLIASIAIGTTIMAGNFRERAIESAEQQLQNTVLLMARHFDQQLEDFMSVQRDLVAQIEGSKIATPDAFRAQLSSTQWHDLLRLRLDAMSTAVRAVQLELSALGGRGYLADSPTARRLREAAFLPVQSPTEALACRDAGYGFVMVSADTTLFSQGARALAAGLRS